jgi:ABC-2 type transport system ATP-binding protein
MADADLYLFDEPSANLDPRALSIFLRRARRLAEDGRGVLFTTHVAADVESLATRVEVLSEGRLESQATVRRSALRSASAGSSIVMGPWSRGRR